tara:strand:+ start:77827 stop:77997 length:171 start_codon:yes stop_codon:yes gene_type:complete
MPDNLDLYGGMNLYRAPIVTDRANRQIKDIVKRTWSPPVQPWPPGARRILEREYTR